MTFLKRGFVPVLCLQYLLFVSDRFFFSSLPSDLCNESWKDLLFMGDENSLLEWRATLLNEMTRTAIEGLVVKADSSERGRGIFSSA